MFTKFLNDELWLVKTLVLVALVAVGYAVQTPDFLASTFVQGISKAHAQSTFYRVTQGTLRSSMPAGQGIGDLSEHGFRFACVPSHYSYDDPVVFPGKQGAAHLHMFFGNTAVSYKSTSDSIINSGRSTCAGGITNRSAYWVPALFNAKGEPVLPDEIVNYYKSWVPGRENLKPIPQGLQILANDKVKGSSGVTVARPGHPEDVWDASIGITDHDGITISVHFPDCVAVDRNGDPILTSPGGTSHVAYSGYEGCPASHPYHIPTLTQNIRYDLPFTSNWQLASDPSSAQKGTTAHADYMAGWTKEAAKILTDCVRDGHRECGPSMISNDGELSITPSTGKEVYAYQRLQGSADPTPMGVWPKMLSGSMTHTDMDMDDDSDMDMGNTDDTLASGSDDDLSDEEEEGSEEVVEENTDTKSIQKGKRIQTTDRLKVRATPGGTKIAVVAKGAKGTYLRNKAIKSGNLYWVKVQFDDGKVGYVAKKYTTGLKNQTSTPPKPTFTPTTTSTEYKEMLALIQELMARVAALQARLNKLNR